MKYTVASIPTLYNGLLFRSRLEAKWAAFFDLLGWEWQYEPTDFNGWIPDFAIYGKVLVYVEVKPVLEFPQEVADKIESSGCSGAVLIVGQRLFPCDECKDMTCIGWLSETDPPPPDHPSEVSLFNWGQAAFGKWNEGKGTIGFCHTWASYRDRISGGYNGSIGGVAWDRELSDEVKSFWAEACNKTMWAPK